MDTYIIEVQDGAGKKFAPLDRENYRVHDNAVNRVAELQQEAGNTPGFFKYRKYRFREYESKIQGSTKR